ncbi:RNA polymerase II subunit A C-terminal domain phosphatase isoform X2 [Engraulis encrasicolus]|uniref:RNA polymerase II subunit A C-terminal domain phosphatase isoform X2 n=1 Tax=Engraulis encrasicolus TaxID=184585 RepID=UPI002FD2F4F6
MEDPADSGGGGAAAPEGPTAGLMEVRCPPGACPLRLLEWKVKPGSFVNVDSVLALCAPIRPAEESEAGVREQANRLPEKKVKSDRAGVVKELCCQVGQVISPGGVVARIEECSHPIVMKGMCAECGKDLAQLQSKNGKQQVQTSTANVSMVHSVPELMVSSEQAELLGREDQQRLHRNRKLVLMVDLDQTLIHTTEQHCRRLANKGIFHFQLGRGEPMLHTRLRPHCKNFLEKIAKLYELHVFTFGSRLYAHTIAGFLDPEKKLFSHRILSRDECIDPYSKTGNLRNLFPSGDNMVCIIDDREDVWKFAPNLVTVKKYVYFQGTGDINAPPGSREATRKGAQAGKVADGTAESTDATATTSASEEQSNGLRKRARDRHAQPPPSTSTSSTQGNNDRTQGEAEGEGGSGEVKGEVEAQSRVGGDDMTEAERKGDAGSSGSSSSSAATKESRPQEKESEGAEKTNASTEHTAGTTTTTTSTNDLDFNLSSDSDEESDLETKAASPQPAQGSGDPASAASKEESGDSGEKRKEASEERDGPSTRELGNGDSPQSSEKQARASSTAKSESSGDPSTTDNPIDEDDVDMGDDEEDDDEEDEDDEEEDRDHDDHLIYLEEVLRRVHGEYYSRYDAYLSHNGAGAAGSAASAAAAASDAEQPDMRKIVPELKGRVLAGTTVVFSGLYPTNYPMERTREFYHARALGARIARSLVLTPKEPDSTTHLIAARAGTDKVRQALRCKHLHVVNPDWLWGCLERWEKVQEQLYPIKEDYSKGARSSSPAFFPDPPFSPPLHGPPQPDSAPRPPPPEVRTYDPVTGKLNRHHPPPTSFPTHHHHQQQPRPPPPEVRTYDPVTGKLIRRGPQQHKSSYGHAGPSSSSSSSSSSSRSTFSGQSPDDEQPGPSKRNRQPSMSETNPLYMLCKEDLDDMDKEVDDILGEESDNESDEQRKEEEEKMEVEGGGGGRGGADEEEEEKPQTSQQSLAAMHHHHHQQQQQQQQQQATPTAAGPSAREERRHAQPSHGACLAGSDPRGQKRKLESTREEEEDDDEKEEKEDKSTKAEEKEKEDKAPSNSQSSKDSSDDDEDDDDDEDEMAAALEAELNDFM